MALTNVLQDPAAERAVIASVMTYGADAYLDVADIVTPKTFTIDSNQLIWACYDHIFRDDSPAQVDYPTLMSAAHSLGLKKGLEKQSEVTHIRGLMNMAVAQQTGRRMAGKVRKLEIARLFDAQLEQGRTRLQALTGDESIEAIIASAEEPVLDLSSLLIGGTSSGPRLMGAGAREYIQHLMDNPREMMGISTGMKGFDRSIGGGMRANSLDIIAARPKTGKAQPWDASVHTPCGVCKMRDIVPGMTVCTPFGTSIVDSVYPQGVLPVYRVTFSDGDSTECCADHLWEVKHRRKQTYEVRSTKDLMTRLKEAEGSIYERPRWQVRLPESVAYDASVIPMNAYTLGVLIGNGGLTNGIIGLTSADTFLVEEAGRCLDKGYEFCKIASREAGNQYTLKGPREGIRNVYITILTELGLFGCSSKTKFIPEKYLINSRAVRLALLQGLMDTDGGADERGMVEYSTASPRLAKDIKTLTQSLGYLCNVTERTTKCDGKSFVSFRLYIATNDNSQLFRLPRKRELCHARKKPPLKRTIDSIVPVGRKQCQCIKLQDERGLYLTDNFIVTHNTQIVDNVGLHVAGNEHIPVFNLDTEMSWEEHLHRIIGNMSGVQVVDIETGKVGFKDIPKQKALDACDRLATMPYHYECIIGKAFEEVMSSMRRWVTRTVGLDANGKAKPCVIIYDYLKMLSGDFLSKDIQEYQALGFITTALKNFMGRYGVPCLCFAQLNREGIDREDTGVISGSDRIIHYATSFSIYKWKSDEERAEMSSENCKYTHKLVPIIARHGEGLQGGDYINIQSEYSIARVTEGPTRNELLRGSDANRNPQGTVMEDDEDDEEGDDDGIPFR